MDVFVASVLAVFVVAGLVLRSWLRSRPPTRRRPEPVPPEVIDRIRASLDPPPPPEPALVTAEGMYASTQVRWQGQSRYFKLVAFKTPGTLIATEHHLLLKGAEQVVITIPYTRVKEASITRLVGDFGDQEAPPLLRVEWQCAGEWVLSCFFLQGGLREIERFRKEIHLRAKLIVLPTVGP